MADQTINPTQSVSAFRRPALTVVICFILFGAVLAFMAMRATDDEWQRLLTLFYSIEAIGFAAAGLLFGATVETPSRHAFKALADSNQAFEQKVITAQGTADAAAIDLNQVEETLQALPPETMDTPQVKDAMEMVSKVKSKLNQAAT